MTWSMCEAEPTTAELAALVVRLATLPDDWCMESMSELKLKTPLLYKRLLEHNADVVKKFFGSAEEAPD